MRTWIILILFLVGCEFNKNDEVKASSFQYEFYNFPGVIELNTDMIINAKDVIFEKGSKIRLNNHDLYLVADTIDFSDSEVFSFEEFDYNGCENNGRDGGSIYIDAKKIVGNPILQLKGENAGKNGSGYRIDANNDQIYHPDDLKISKTHYHIKNECEPSRDFSRKTVESYWVNTIYHGGNSGNVYLNPETDISFFYPELQKKYGRGDFVFTAMWKSGDFTHYPSLKTGNNGTIANICLDEAGFEKCFEEISLLKNYFNQREI